MKFGVVLLACLIAPLVTAGQTLRDVITRHRAAPLTGRVVSADTTSIQCEVILAEGQPLARVTLPRQEIRRVVFAPDERLENYLEKAGPANLPELDILWRGRLPLLGLPESNAGQVGLALAGQLLKTSEPAKCEQALSIFKVIETSDWNSERRASARIGRLRTMLALGQDSEAVREAREIESNAPDPASLIEAKFVLAEAGFAELRKLLKENPRWRDDENVSPERDRIYHETADLYLYPFLFHGSDQPAAARGLWRATELHQAAGETEQALATAGDIVELYSNSPEANPAKEFLTSQPH